MHAPVLAMQADIRDTRGQVVDKTKP
jgi:hypothetical protein